VLDLSRGNFAHTSMPKLARSLHKMLSLKGAKEGYADRHCTPVRLTLSLDAGSHNCENNFENHVGVSVASQMQGSGTFVGRMQ
jgi:hypothetical protein